MAGAGQWRDDALRALLEERRRDLHDEWQRRMMRIRDESERRGVVEPDGSDADDLDARLLELTASTLRRIERALLLLEQGRYGRCTRCRRPIHESRLRALPFAVRCHSCEAAREREVERRHAAMRTRPLWTEIQVEERASRD
jgi:DnaK suppressor protein